VIASESESITATEFRVIAEQSSTRERTINASKRARQRILSQILLVNEETHAMSRKCMVMSARVSSLAAMTIR
jgi:hypothetical protein